MIGFPNYLLKELQNNGKEMTPGLFALVFSSSNYLNEWQEVCRLQREAHSSIEPALSWSALIKNQLYIIMNFVVGSDALFVHFVVYVVGHLLVE